MADPQDWYDFGIRDASSGGSILAPRIAVSDFGRRHLGYTTGDAGQQDLGSVWEMNRSSGRDYGLWNNMGTGSNNFQVDPGLATDNSFEAWIKSADKEASKVKYTREGDYWVPSYMGTQNWNTNPQAKDYIGPALVAAAPFAIPAAVAAAGIGGAGGAAGTAAGAAGAGMAAGEGAMIGPGMGAGLPGAGGGFNISQALNLAKTGLQGLSGAQKIAGALGLGGAGGAGGGSQSRTNMQASAPRNWLDQVMGIGSGVYSDVQNREAFTNLNDLFSRREQARAPFEQALTRSFTNPEDYLGGPEYQALAAVRGNQLNRGAAQKGRLANDVDREVLMQQHAQKGLADYRQSLTSALGQQNLPYEIFRDAQTRNAQAGGPTAGGINFSGVSGGIDDIIRGATGFGGTISDIFQGFGGYNPADMGDMGPPDLGGIGDLGGFDNIDMSQWSMPDFDWGGFDWSSIF